MKPPDIFALAFVVFRRHPYSVLCSFHQKHPPAHISLPKTLQGVTTERKLKSFSLFTNYMNNVRPQCCFGQLMYVNLFLDEQHSYHQGIPECFPRTVRLMNFHTKSGETMLARFPSFNHFILSNARPDDRTYYPSLNSYFAT